MVPVDFSHPWLLLLIVPILALPLVRGLAIFRRRGLVALSSCDWLPASLQGTAVLRRLPELLRVAALACLVLTAAGPRGSAPVLREKGQRETLVVVLDVSSSMTAEDFSRATGSRPPKGC